MLVTNHVLAGALLGAVGPLRRRPVAAFAVGVASHAAMDVVPHWGDVGYEEFLTVAVVDGIVGLATLGALTRLALRQRRWAVLAGMAGAVLPDLDKPSRLFLGSSPFPVWVDDAHARIQNESSRRMPQEVLVAAGALALAATLLRRAR